MQAGELFINLKIKGGDDAVRVINTTKQSLKDTKSGALEVKASLLAVVAVLREMYSLASASLSTGKNLSMFQNLLGAGGNLQELQQWQQWLMHAQVSAQETTNAFLGLSSAMSKVVAKGDQGQMVINALTSTVGLDVNRAQADPGYLMGQLKKYADYIRANEKGNPGLRAMSQLVLGEFLPQNVAAGLFSPAFLKSFGAPLDKSRAVSGKEVAILNEVGAGWNEFIQRLEASMTRLVVAVGPDLVDGLNALSYVLEALSATLGKLYPKDQIHDMGNFLKDRFNEGMKSTVPLSTTARDLLNGIWGPAPQGKPVTVNNTVHVNGANDPEETARFIADELSRLNTQAFHEAMAQSAQAAPGMK